MSNPIIPTKVFIIPYRNRAEQKYFFCNYMTHFILNNDDDYEIYFAHQSDERSFNRGGMRNIGFLAVKEKYPEHYQNITFIFNDVDTLPFNKIFNYQTTKGIVKHYYGFQYALGGIVVIKGGDFEKINGYPCYWGWGMEDNALQMRCNRGGLFIDRSQFYEIGNPQILQLFDGMNRIICKADPWRSTHDNGEDGLNKVHNLHYTINMQSNDPKDNIYTIINPRIFFVNISRFSVYLRYESDEYYDYDLREPHRKIIHPNKLKKANNVMTTTEHWKKDILKMKPPAREPNISTSPVQLNPYITTMKEVKETKRTKASSSIINQMSMIFR
jgi:hypothetical protein